MKTDIVYCENDKCPLRFNCLRFKEKSKISEEYLFWWGMGAYNKKTNFCYLQEPKFK